MMEPEIARDALTGPRRVEWCPWGITFCRGSRVVATLVYPLPRGWCSGWPTGGFAERERYRAACRAWITTGVLPEERMKP